MNILSENDKLTIIACTLNSELILTSKLAEMTLQRQAMLDACKHMPQFFQTLVIDPFDRMIFTLRDSKRLLAKFKEHFEKDCKLEKE